MSSRKKPKTALPAVTTNEPEKYRALIEAVGDDGRDHTMMTLAEYQRDTGYALPDSRDMPTLAKACAARFYKACVYPRWFLDMAADAEAGAL